MEALLAFDGVVEIIDSFPGLVAFKKYETYILESSYTGAVGV